MNLNDTPTFGPLTAADLEAARQHSTGNVLHLHRVTVCPPCTGHCNQGRQCAANTPAECCTEIGAEPDPYDGTEVFRGLASAIAITAILAGVLLALS